MSRNQTHVSDHNKKVMTDGAYAYAAANKSDPFALRRALTHVANGVAGFTYARDGTRQDAFYKAEKGKEERTLAYGQTFSDGSNKYTVETYHNIQRP